MIRLKIEEKSGQNYVLKAENGDSYEMNFEFFNLDKEPDKNDYINISAELLNTRYKGFSKYLSFGKMDNICGRNESKLNEGEIIKIEIEDKEIYLKRLYG